MACHPIADRFEILEVAKPVGTAACGLDDAVDGLDGCGGDAVWVVSEEAFPMIPDGLGHLLEWGQSAAHCPGAPSFEVESCTGFSRPSPGVPLV